MDGGDGSGDLVAAERVERVPAMVAVAVKSDT